ncbi:hypothetical protein GW950_00435 [Candidatus Wolfebacteria bacterium]|nr:hypothetical protein [Candidatus Wolfebacteria bacterium]
MSYKLFISSIIIGLSVAGAVFITQTNLNKENNAELEINNAKKSLTTQLSNIKNNTNYKTDLKSFLSKNNTGESLTDQFTKKIEEEIIANNTNGPELISGKTWLNAPDLEKLTDDLINSAQEEFNSDNLKKIINESNLKISQNNSKENLRYYLINFSKIINDGSQQIDSKIFSENYELSIEDVRAVKDAHEYIFQEISKLEVPQLFVSIHKKELELLGTKINIYQSILNYENDPLATILSATELEKVDKGFASLTAEVNNLITQYDL